MKPFIAGHQDLVHDIAYDFYGSRIATGSSDQHIHVFDKDAATGWAQIDSWKAHDSAIVKVCWAGPEWGQIIASCSHDATVRIFEEDPREPPMSGRRWKKRHTITDFRGPIYDIEFAPSHLGLKLASIGCDGVLRIHEPLDPSSLSGDWSTSTEINLLTNLAARHLQSSFALSWSPSPYFKDYLVVCALEDAIIFKRVEGGGGGSGSGPGSGGSIANVAGGDTGAMTVGSAGSSGAGGATGSNIGSTYVKVAELPGHDGLIRDVAWAPSMGRGYQLIATASKDGFVRVFRINEEPDGTVAPALNTFDEMTADESIPNLKVQQLGSFDDHHGEVWRVSWNLTGTILASAGDDARVRFWKASYNQEFQCMAVVSAEQRLNDY